MNPNPFEQVRLFNVVLSAIGWALGGGFLLAFWAIVDAHLGG